MNTRHFVAALLAIVLAGCATHYGANNSAAMQRLVDSINARLEAANRGDRDAAMDVCNDAFALNNQNRSIRNNVNLAWYWCSNLAKENNPRAQYLTAWLLHWRDFDYSDQIRSAPGYKAGDEYLEALYWYRMAIKNGYSQAEPSYQELLKYYNSEYGSGRSDLFGKIVAGAFIGGVAKSAGASNALTANAVGAFAADAATNGQAQASASFLRNAGPSELPPPLKRDSTPTTLAVGPSSLPVAPSPKEKKTVAASKPAVTATESRKNPAASNPSTLVKNNKKTDSQSATKPAPAADSGCIASGTVIDRSKLTEACWKDKQNAFGWGDNMNDACYRARESMVAEFNGKNGSGCYCKENGTVNTVVQPYVCWVFFK